MHDARVSIITASFNSEDYLLDTYESIKNQTVGNWQWIITDDCSKDKTVDIIRAISKRDERVLLLINEKNSGAAVSRNKSISKASGEFVAFLDSDDVWHPKKLEAQIKFMDSNNIDFSFTAYELIDKDGNLLGKKIDGTQSGHFTYEDMLKKKATLGCSTVMLRRSAFDDLSMPLLRTGQDYATWLRLLRAGHKAYVLNDVFTQYRILPNSISRNKFKKSLRQWAIYRQVEKLALFKSIYCFLFYAWRAVFRR